MPLRVTAYSLNIRGGPGTRFPVKGSLSQGAVIEPLDTAGWVPIALKDGTVGWVAEKYLEKVPDEPYVPAPDSQEYDFSTKEGTIAAIIAECRKQGLSLPAQIAYVLATVEWETARTFKPVREAFWKTEEWRRHNLRYYPYYGRGYVQLTWKNNYALYTERLRKRFPERADQIDLVKNPDQALSPEFALFILVDGFKTGAFTGKKLTDYVKEHQTDFVGARWCINKQDRAQEIAALAEKFLKSI